MGLFFLPPLHVLVALVLTQDTFCPLHMFHLFSSFRERTGLCQPPAERSPFTYSSISDLSKAIILLFWLCRGIGDYNKPKSKERITRQKMVE